MQYTVNFPSDLCLYISFVLYLLHKPGLINGDAMVMIVCTVDALNPWYVNSALATTPPCGVPLLAVRGYNKRLTIEWAMMTTDCGGSER